MLRSILFLTIAAACWGLNFHLAKVMLAQVSFLEAGFWRYIFGVGTLALINAPYFRSWAEIEWNQHLKGILLVGLIGLFSFSLLFFWGLEHTSALNAALIVSLNPGLTLLLDSWLTGSKLQRLQQWGVGIAMIGVVLLITKGTPQLLLSIEWAWGDLIMLGANSVFAMYHIWVKKYGAKLPNLPFTFFTNALCLVGFLVLLPFGSFRAVYSSDLAFWLAAIGMGVPGTALAYVFWNKGIARVGASQAGFYMNVVPLAAALFAVLFGERLYFYHLVSGSLILAGMFLLNTVSVAKVPE